MKINTSNHKNSQMIKDDLAKIEKLDKTKSITKSIIKAFSTVSEPVIPGASIVGNAAGETFGKIMGNYIGNKQNEILLSIADGLSKLEEQVKTFEIKLLENDERFATTVLQILPLSLQTMNEKKKISLRNIVLNTALGNTPEEDIRQIFLNYITSFTTWHFILLSYFSNPKLWFESKDKAYPSSTKEGMSSVLEHAFPELKQKSNFYKHIINELVRLELLQERIFQGGIVMDQSIYYKKRTTEFGEQFLNFIKSPINE